VKKELEGRKGRPLISRSSEDLAQRLLLLDLVLKGGIQVKCFHMATWKPFTLCKQLHWLRKAALRERERERDLNKVTSKYKHCFLDSCVGY